MAEYSPNISLGIKNNPRSTKELSMQRFIKLLFITLLSTLILSGCVSHSHTHKAPMGQKKRQVTTNKSTKIVTKTHVVKKQKPTKVNKTTKVVTKTLVVTNQKSSKENKQSSVGNDRDKHGCISSAGYTWSQAQNKCVRLWEENSMTKKSHKRP